MGRLTILVVDDEAGLLDIARAILANNGYDVRVATTAEEALAHDAPIDVLLADVVMPGMKGPELAEKISEHHPGIRVLFMSGYDEGRLGACGAFRRGYRTILKPFTPEGLLDTLEILLGEPAPTFL